MSSPSSHSSSTESNGDDDFEIPISRTTPSADRTTTPLGTHVDESDDGFQTPTNMTIPLTAVCPPAPKSRNRFATSSFQDDDRRQQDEVDLQLLIDVSVWLDFVEDEDRIKRVRRQEDQGDNDTTTKTL